MELAYAGPHQLCAPMLDLMVRLPAPQRHALEIVFGVRAGAVVISSRATCALPSNWSWTNPPPTFDDATTLSPAWP
jgi:hypothetical protein